MCGGVILGVVWGRFWVCVLGRFLPAQRRSRNVATSGMKPSTFIARATSIEVRGRKAIYLFYPF